MITKRTQTTDIRNLLQNHNKRYKLISKSKFLRIRKSLLKLLKIEQIVILIKLGKEPLVND